MSRNATKRHDLALFASHFRNRVALKKRTTTARESRYFRRIWARHKTGWHVTIRDSQSRLACVGWRLCVQPTAIAPYHPIRVARLGSWLKARAKSNARVPKVARRRTRLRSGGLGEPPLYRSADPATCLDRARAIWARSRARSHWCLWAPPIEHQPRAICIVSHPVDIRCECA